ncbi:MAG: hypothetical protein MSIBF_06095 [Candidatus Altiarchaeales archaeon IMC4]|nr:MAG: hypothetical protein MSIBF_06095 [Candidatus Altiarchaeales archaeon IMC4]
MIYLDTSVIVNSFFTHESKAEQSKKLMEKIRDGKYTACTSEFTLLEIVSAISRRTNDANLASGFTDGLRAYPHIRIIPLSGLLFDKALEIAADTRLRAGDSIQVASAVLENAECLVQRDTDFERAKYLIKILEPEDLLS